jgi:3-oxoacyl-[acyl-carrier protein] reductase
MNHFLTDEDLLQLTEEIPTGRLGQANEVADLVYQLSQNNQYLTGQIIGLDGGWV